MRALPPSSTAHPLRPIGAWLAAVALSAGLLPCGSAHGAQVDETQAMLLGDGQRPEAFARRLLDLGPRGALVTLGAAGCLAAWREGGTVRTVQLPAAERPAPAYPTGCGDVFGASFAYAQLRGASVAAAVLLANGIAGTKAGFEPHTELVNIRARARAHLRRCFADGD